jgi:drug/metabolite transporter (DMT)-like permease
MGAILIGFLGVLIVVRPSGNGLTVYALLAVASSAISATRDLITRSIDPSVPSAVVALMSAVAGAVAGLALGATESWIWPPVLPVTYLAGAGLLVTLGNLAIVIAYRNAELGVVAPFRYLSIAISLALGYLVFGTLPDTVSFAGILLIMAGGIYTIYREQARRREELGAAARLAAAPAAQAGARRPA